MSILTYLSLLSSNQKDVASIQLYKTFVYWFSVIEEANWLTLTEDIQGLQFDAVMCLGNSFAHLTSSVEDIK
jgi:hypothetical protein